MAVPQDQLRNFLPTQRIPFQDFSTLIEGMSEEQSRELCEHFSVITIDFVDENELLVLPEQIRNAIHRVGFVRAGFFDRGPSVLYDLDDDEYDGEGEEVVEWEEGEGGQMVEEDERSKTFSI